MAPQLRRPPYLTINRSTRRPKRGFWRRGWARVKAGWKWALSRVREATPNGLAARLNPGAELGILMQAPLVCLGLHLKHNAPCGVQHLLAGSIDAHHGGQGVDLKRLELPVRIAMPRITEPPSTSRRRYHLLST